MLQARPLVLTGAGVSTDSGIPDYRGPRGSLRRHRPMTYQEFSHDDESRKRYWARSFVGWRLVNATTPNPAHRILARWNESGRINGIVTQNVDGLHRAAASAVAVGSESSAPLVALHGDLDRVTCLDCGTLEQRSALDERLEVLNPGYIEAISVEASQINPDGDVDLDETWVHRFVMAQCTHCSGYRLKPDVVYFGENVPVERKQRARQLLDSASGLIVIGSSVAVMSGYRSVLDAARASKPVAVINGGPSRADQKATYRWRSSVTEALKLLDAEV